LLIFFLKKYIYFYEDLYNSGKGLNI